MMNIETISVGVLEVNCYLAWDPDSGEGIVIDPGDEAPKVIAACEARRVRPAAVYLTHAHVDHIRGVTGVAGHFGIPVILDEADHRLYHSPNNALPPWIAAAENLPAPGVPPQFDTFPEPEIIATPGHTPGGVCIHFPWEKMLFTGDTLFAGSVGRTDFPGGNAEHLLNSIRKQLLTLPENTRIYPGHGIPSTIGDEKRSNPFI